MQTPYPIPFGAHSMGVKCFSASDLKVQYGSHSFTLCENELARAKVNSDDQRGVNGVDIAIKGHGESTAIMWRSKDGSSHRYLFNMSDLFSDGLVPHEENEADIYKPNPLPIEPTIIVEVNDTILNVFMESFIVLLPANKDLAQRKGKIVNSLVFTKDFKMNGFESS